MRLPLLATLAAASLAAAMPAQARTFVSVGIGAPIGYGYPGYGYRPYAYYPGYYAPPPVYYVPRPVYYAPHPAYYRGRYAPRYWNGPRYGRYPGYGWRGY